MSGAFNIDIEVGPSDKKGVIKIYCSSLTNTWTVDRNSVELAQFHNGLSKDDIVKHNKLYIPPCPKTDNATACELFLSQLGCNAAILRIQRFHEFLSIPEDVKKGLAYATHKPFGTPIRAGYLQKHPRFVRKGGGKRWIRLTQDERGGSLICYKDENSQKNVVASLKIGASTEMKNLTNDGIPNAFVLKSGKRQWILQAQSNREYYGWQSAISQMVKKLGGNISAVAGPTDDQKQSIQTENNNQSSQNVSTAVSLNVGASSMSDNKLLKQNVKLKQELEQKTEMIRGMQEEIAALKEKAIEAGSNTEEMRRKIQKEFHKKKDELERDYELQHENLRAEIEELHRKLEAKTAMEGGHSAMKTLFGDGFKIGIGEDDELQAEIDAEKKLLDSFSEEEKATIKYIHKHLHRHDHKHIHHHRHVHHHIHDGDNKNKSKENTESIVATHTISHTITHTNTQFKIKKSFF